MHKEKELLRNFYSSWAQSVSLYTRRADHYNISYPVLMTLYALYSRGSLTQKKISEFFGLPKQTVHSSVRYLEKRDYISLTPGTRDRREKIIFLTEEGRAYAGELLTPLFEAEENICRTIGIERLEEMINTNDLYNLLFEKEMKRRIKHHD
ncbi:hypothetical protein B5E53_09015 [Eubacterium sp. An11]|uniref:MarR family winged helix-turn-helix transcriptional regulator n=1 Tax=Eubacterium sp. An11 TaxID=1965542 RepID=UPI000B37DFD6|nr:MarR family transcriptional regulator [Eubacterium sp. An11]OUQ67330.1 hypothetical protein B5E53_09015 [Eubacterium sp. An11]